MQKEKLFTRSYIFACIGNFLNCFGFYMLLPILPIFLIEKYRILQSHTGIILASYTFSAMIGRPIFAYFSDLFNRKTLYCLLLLIYSLLFLPYPFFEGMAFFLIIRSVHGFVFGAQSVCGNALITDIVDENRRGEGFGYFGISNSIAMAAGPMAGLYIHETTYDFFWIFIIAFLLCIAGFICILEVHLPKEKKRIERTPENKKLSFDKFFQIKGVYAGISLILLSYPYGLIVSFSALYGKELGILEGTGLFFALMSAGLILSRIFSGKIIDRGKLTTAITFGIFLVSLVLTLFSAIGFVKIQNIIYIKILFYLVGLFMGLGYGITFPAFNTLFVNLSPDNRRAAASSTYLTCWDVGLGGGLILGGIIMEKWGMSVAYSIGAISTFVSALYFSLFVSAHFRKNKLR
ncbi:MAG: MFS transporter [Chitinispirillales bacterium]|jgi:MFS family permease|nr:MFS transporter [Chitinispirillales bacterium]